MRKTTFSINNKASVGLSSMVARKSRNLRPPLAARAMGFRPQTMERIQESDLISVLVETPAPDAVLKDVVGARPKERIQKLEGGFLSARVGTDVVAQFLQDDRVTRLQSKKRHVPHLSEALPAIGLLAAPTGARAVAEDGKGVLIGIVDSGFDLSHPMFRDAAGKLRVDGLLDQTDRNNPAREYTRAQLESGWASGGRRPGKDENGHGTHVASIAGGSRHKNHEGVAPGARFLLVKTNFLDTDDAVSWIFRKAKTTPCVVNMSLGHHFGAHDGTDAEERLHATLTGPGKILVVSAGNERNDPIHIGGRFHSGQREEVVFDVHRQQDDPPFVTLTLWHNQVDQFEGSLVSPNGQEFPLPALGNSDTYESSLLDIEVARRAYSWSNSVQVQIALSFKRAATRPQDLQNWRVRMSCTTATVGRLDGWFHNSGFASFRAHPLLEQARTVGLPATGEACLAVASHVSRTSWTSDLGAMQDNEAVAGRTSSFSSLGPTRGGQWKPDISAPGQYLTAALAEDSELAGVDERALSVDRVLSIEGTSMAAPVVAGVVALLLQKRPDLEVARIRQLLSETAQKDDHTGPAPWNPAYGYGKIAVVDAIARA